jgi:hypothetical protein
MPVALPTREDLFQIGAQEILARSASRPERSRISPAAIFTEGTNVNVLLASMSAMGDECLRHLAIREAARVLDTAEDEDLDRAVQNFVSRDIPRLQARPSLVPLRISRSIPPSAGAAINIARGTKVRTPAGIEFETLEICSLSASSTGPVSVEAQAVKVGPEGNVEAGTISQWVTTPSDPYLVVTNSELASGGDYVETNAAYRARAKDFFRAARRGVIGAIEYGAGLVSGVRSATAEELVDENGLPTGVVRMYIADALGRANSSLIESVSRVLSEYRCCGIWVTLVGAIPSYQQIQYALSFKDGTNIANAREQLKLLTVAVVNMLAPSEPLRLSLLGSLARQISGAVVPSYGVEIPAADVTPIRGRVIKTSYDRVLVNGA